MPQKYHFGTRHFYLGEEWVKMGHEVSIFTANTSHLTNKLPKFHTKTFTEFIQGIRTIWLKTYHSPVSSSGKRILSWFHFEWQLLTSKKAFGKPDIVYVSSLSLFSIVSGYYYSKKFKAKLVFEVRDIWPLTAMVLGGYKATHPFILFLSFIEKFGYKKADLIIGTMPNHIAHVKSVYPGYRKWACIPQGVNLEFYSSMQASLSQDYVNNNIPVNKFIVAYTGMLNANNPLSTFLNAAKMLQDEKRIHFLILGQGTQRKQLIEESSNLENVTILEPIPKNQVNHFLSFCSITYDSIDAAIAEFGISRNKWIDYMMASKPIVCSYNGFQSMINEAQCGQFIPYNDSEKLAEAIRYYASLPDEQLSIVGNRGRDFLIRERRFNTLAEKFLNELS